MFDAGDMVEDRWEVLGPLDTGSMSVVYHGRDTRDGHPVAIKVMKPDVARDPIAVQRCVREARLTQSLSHPNIVRVEGAGLATDGRPYIIMELLTGETLEACLGRQRLGSDTVAEVIAQVGAAIDVAHGAGIVHRDLKPDNVYLVADAKGIHTKVLDFGFAKLSERPDSSGGFRTESNALLGTPLYMAPEQIRSSRDVDFRADLWSLGVMAYELLVGAAPFASRPVVDLFVEILSAPIPPPSQRVHGLPPSVDGWAARALDRDPSRRFQSGKALAESFSAALRGVTTEPPPPARPAIARAAAPRPTSATARGWTAAAFVLAAVLAVLLAVLVGSRLAHAHDLLAPVAGP